MTSNTRYVKIKPDDTVRNHWICCEKDRPIGIEDTILSGQPFITLDRVTVRLRDRRLLADTCWQIRTGENWVIWGPNGAGKSTLAQVLTGRAAVVQGSVIRHGRTDPAAGKGRLPVALVSAEQYHQLYHQERLQSEMRHFSGSGRQVTAGDLLDAGAPADRQAADRLKGIFDGLELGSLAARPLNALSSGEMRKLLLGQALMHDPELLVLDEPFNGLDAASRLQLSRILVRLAGEGRQMVLITHRLSEISDCFQHVLQLDQGRVIWQGDTSAFLARMADPARPPTAALFPARVTVGVDAPAGPPVIRMRNVTVRFGRQRVLDRVDWTVHPGEHWALLGPNGAGKSTLLELISGDQLQAYANEIELFGRARGTGESIWEIKQHIGHVDDRIQARYQRRLTGFDVICSGFFDSVGLFRHCTDAQRRKALHMVQTLEIAESAGQTMMHLSFGQQRMILIARAAVKSPRLLILDEPCSGLDMLHRRQLLALLDRIGLSGATQLLYVSHRPDEIPACTTHRLYLDGGKVVARHPPPAQNRPVRI
jgi:molybdate transport system ATP-binding protein